jgi:antitoxin ParD1/3/4
MEITLTPELEDLLNEELQTGDYFSPTDVLRESLLLLREMKKPKQVRLENLRREVMKGVDAMREGNYKTYNADELDNFVEEIIDRGRKKLNKKNGER